MIFAILNFTPLFLQLSTLLSVLWQITDWSASAQLFLYIIFVIVILEAESMRFEPRHIWKQADKLS